MSERIPARVRQDLAERREAGEPFPDAWAVVVAAVRGRERDEWQAALRSTAEAWARAYADLPLTPRERALSLVATDLEPLQNTRCGWCRKPLPRHAGAAGGSTATTGVGKRSTSAMADTRVVVPSRAGPPAAEPNRVAG